MKISRRWLKDYVDFDISPEEMADRLTALRITARTLFPDLDHLAETITSEMLTEEGD